MMDYDVLYIASGQEYVEEAVLSASRLKEYDIPCTLITSSQAKIAADESIFDDIIRNDMQNQYIDKVKYISNSHYEKTVFLDTDTAVIGDIRPMFDLLEQVDIAVARSAISGFKFADIPDAFPYLNTGVIAYNNTERINTLFNDWKDAYESRLKNGFPDENDQPSFRHTLYNSNVSHSILPQEYNFRGPGSSASSKVKIVHHRRLINNEIFMKYINEKEAVRCIWRWKLFRRGEQDVTFENKFLLRLLYHINQVVPITRLLETIGQLDRAKKYYTKYISK